MFSISECVQVPLLLSGVGGVGVAPWLLPVSRLICCCYGAWQRERASKAETAPCTQMCPGSTVGALGDTEHSISLSGHTLFSSQKAATQQGANLLLQWGGWGVGGGLGNNNHCTVRAPVTAPSSDYISFEHTHEPFLLVWEWKSDEECLPLGGCVCVFPLGVTEFSSIRHTGCRNPLVSKCNRESEIYPVSCGKGS